VERNYQKLKERKIAIEDIILEDMLIQPFIAEKSLIYYTPQD